MYRTIYQSILITKNNIEQWNTIGHALGFEPRYIL